MDSKDGIQVDSLAVAFTRPSTKWGVPFEALVANLIVSAEAMVLAHDALWMGLSVPVHGICYLITLNDPRAFEVLALWLRTTLGTLLASRWYWSASSYSPLTFRERFGALKRWHIRRRFHMG